MSWKDEPATEIQISRLRQLGFLPEHPLTKGEAAHLISHHDSSFAKTSGTATTTHETPGSFVEFEAYQLRASVESARHTVFQSDNNATKVEEHLDTAMARRQNFWIDTCREPAQMQLRSPEILDLHMKFGCQYVPPTHEQTQEILDALDVALPSWDKDHPELFYQTLELNFPELRKHI